MNMCLVVRRSLLIAVLGLSMVLIVGCEDQPVEAVQAANTGKPYPTNPNVPDGVPQLTFDKLMHDFGTISDTRKYDTTFKFRNTGNGRLTISDVKAGCGCTTVGLSRYEFAPGEGDEIKVTFDGKRKKNIQTKYITVTANVPEESIKLTLRANVKPFLDFSENFLKFDIVEKGTEAKRVVDMYYTDPDLVIKELVPNTPALRAEVVESGVTVTEADGGVSYRTRIMITVPPDAPWGSLFAARINVVVFGREELDQPPVDHSFEIMVTGLIFGDLHASYMDRRGAQIPSAVTSFSKVGKNTPFERVINITRRSRAPFDILDARLIQSIPGSEVFVEQMSPYQYKVGVRGNTGTHHGTVRNIVKVRTNVPGEDELTLYYNGYVE